MFSIQTTEKLCLFSSYLDDNSIVNSIEKFLVFLLTILFGWIVAVNLCMVFNFSFLFLSIIFSIFLFSSVVQFLLSNFLKYLNLSKVLFSSDMILCILLFIAGGGIALFVIRPDADDVTYISQAVYFRQHIFAPMGYVNHYHVFPEPASLENAFQTVNILWGYLALIFNTKVINIYHFVVPFLGGMLISITWFYFFSRFSKNVKTALVAALGVVAFLMIDGATHRSFGNFAFVRIWQGKALFISIFIPLFVAYTIDYFRDYDKKYLFRLFLIVFVGISFTMSAFFLFPVLIAAMSFAFVLMNFQNIFHDNHIKSLLYYISIFLPFLAVGFLLYLLKATQLEAIYHTNIQGWWPTSFVKQFNLVFYSWKHPLTLSMAVISLVAVYSLSKRSRIFIISWALFLVVCFLNPIVIDVVTRYLTTHAAYWRLFYALPVLFLPGLVIVWFLNNFQQKWIVLTVTTVLIIGPVIVNGMESNQIFQMGVLNKKQVEFPALGYKLPKVPYEIANSIIKAVPEGDILIPIRGVPGRLSSSSFYAWVLPMLSSNHRVLAVRECLLPMMKIANPNTILKHAEAIAAFISGKKPNGHSRKQFLESLEYPWNAIVIHRKSVDPDLMQMLLNNNFYLKETHGEYQLWIAQQ